MTHPYITYWNKSDYKELNFEKFCELSQSFNMDKYSIIFPDIERAFRVQESKPKRFAKRIEKVHEKLIEEIKDIVPEHIIKEKEVIQMSIKEPESMFNKTVLIPKPVSIPIQQPEIKLSFPTQIDPNLELKKMELAFMQSVVSDVNLKTQITHSERIIVTNLENFAEQPFRGSERIARDRHIPYDFSKCKLVPLKYFCEEYLRKGKAIDRKGIKEDLSMVNGYFENMNKKKTEEVSDIHK